MNTTYRPATRKMVTYLYWRMAERSTFAKTLEPYADFMAKMEKAVAERHPHAAYATVRDLIDAVVEIKADITPTPTPAPKAAATATPDVPAGRYALVNSNDGQTYFFKVDRPTEGRWAGYTFVKRISGDNELRVDRVESRQIIAAIAADPVGSAARYGAEIKRCGMCHKKLTTTESRTLGIGPDCIKKFGDHAEDIAWKAAYARREAEQEQAAYAAKMDRDQF